MHDLIEYLKEFNTVTVLIRLLLAAVAGGIIGVERGKQGRAAGMRTHILVSTGAALTILIGLYIDKYFNFGSDPMRIAAQVISGIGFLGAGTILVKGRFQITGITTAASLWATAAIGLAFGAGFYDGAIICFIIAFLTMSLLHRFEARLNRRQTRFGIYVEISSDAAVRSCIKCLTEDYDASSIQVTEPRSGTTGNVGIEANIHNPKNRLSPDELGAELEAHDFVVFAIESI